MSGQRPAQPLLQCSSCAGIQKRPSVATAASATTVAPNVSDWPLAKPSMSTKAMLPSTQTAASTRSPRPRQPQAGQPRHGQPQQRQHVQHRREAPVAGIKDQQQGHDGSCEQQEAAAHAQPIQRVEVRTPTPPQRVERRHGQARQRRGTLANRPVGAPQGQQLRHPEHQHQRCRSQQHGGTPFQRVAVPDHAIAQLRHHETSGCRPQGQHLHLRQPFGQLPAAGQPQGCRQTDDGPQPAQIPVRIFRDRAGGRELGLAITVEDPQLPPMAPS